MHHIKERTISHQQRLGLRIRGLFDLCDQERKGYVTREELFRLTTEIALTEEEVNNAFFFLDKDKNGSLSLEEFISGFDIFLGNAQVSSEKFHHEEISDSSQLFDLIDKDRKGFITKQDLKIVAEDFKLTDGDIEEIFLQLHKKGMSVLTFRDFNLGLESIGISDSEAESVAMEEEVFTNANDDDFEDDGDVNMDYGEYGQDELKAILTKKATELFKVCDKDNKSYITQEDLLELTKELALTNEQVESAFIKLDTDGNKFLTLDEFVDGFGIFLGVEDEGENDPETLRRQAKSKEMFDLCDKGSKGYVTKTDLMRLTNDLGLSVDQVNLIFDQLDEDNNGFLTVYEFLQGFSGFLDDSQLDGPPGRLGPNILGNDVNDETELSGRTEFPLSSRSPLNREQSIELLDANAKQVISNVDEYITDSLTKEQLAELWKSLRKSDSLTLTKFEEFLINISSEMKKARQETVHLENTLKRKSLSHDIEIQKLYEEMEQQIRNEKSKITELEIRREKVLREELTMQLQEKEFQMNRLASRQVKLEEKLEEYQQQEQSLRRENLTLSKQNLDLEEQLNMSITSLEDTKNYVSSLQESSSQEQQERLRAAMRTTQGIEREHDSLVRQLDMLREMNQKLRDDKDAIEASIKMRAERTTSLDDEIQSAEKRQLQKTGSIMSSYFSSSKRGRQNSGSSTRNKTCLVKQGSIMSNYFESSWGSQESLVYGEGLVGERRLDSVGEDDGPEWRRRVIKAVDEDGESMLESEKEGLGSNTASFDESTASALGSATEGENDKGSAMGDHTRVVTSTPLKSEPQIAKAKLRRVLPTRHGGTTRLSEKSSEEGDVIVQSVVDSENNEFRPKNEVLYADVTDDGENDARDGHIAGAEDQLSATESEADRNVASNVDEEMSEELIPVQTEVMESKQHLQEILDDLARPYAQKPPPTGSKEENKISQRVDSGLSPVREEDPPTNPNRVYKIVFVGDSGVGKSSLIHRFCFDQFKSNFSATIGVDFQVKIIKVFQEWVALQLWDTAGQERFRSITKQYFRKADGVIVMFDICSEASFKNVRSWMNSVEDSAEPECTVMLLGNKLDLADDGFRKVKFDMADRLAKDFDSFYHEVSAKSGNQVRQAMVKMARKLEEKEDSLMKRSVLNLDAASNNKKKKCCSR